MEITENCEGFEKISKGKFLIFAYKILEWGET
jgi:hypothetical protein